MLNFTVRTRPSGEPAGFDWELKGSSNPIKGRILINRNMDKFISKNESYFMQFSKIIFIFYISKFHEETL